LLRGNSSLRLERTANILKLNRGLSISDFYTNFAGLHGDNINPHARDKFNNPVVREYDLGREGAFGRFSVLVGLFSLDTTEKVFMEGPGAALQQKGFRLTCVTDEGVFADKLKEHDSGWIISSDTTSLSTPKLVDACVKYHQAGGGLAIWADNDPFFATANAILKKLFPAAIQLTGDTPGDKDLTLGEPDTAGHFSRTLLTSGLETLYEGVTICYPASFEKQFSILATSTDQHPCMIFADYDKLEPHCGRVVIDCGFTKLSFKWDSAGTGRYVRNVAVWLLGLEHRMSLGVALQGPIALE